MRFKAIALFAVGALVLGVACVETGSVDALQQQCHGLGLQTELVEGTDVEGMHFLITECQSGETMVDEVVPLKEMDLPAGLVEFEGDSFDPESQHRFADYFISLAPGCYDVEIQPVKQGCTGGWEPSFDCAPAMKNGVIVEGEQTTEVVLISQCVGDELGGLDVLAVLNREPELKKLKFFHNKFVGDCDGVVVCVTATDPDCDPLEITWTQVSGPAMDPTPVSRDRDGCDVTECVRFQPEELAAYEFMVTAYDLLISNGMMMRIEDWLALHGYPNDSHASLTFPMYSGVECPPPDPPPQEEECTRTQGYWKNHNKYKINTCQNIPWPDPVDEDDMLCGDTLLDILWTPPAGGNAWIILAHQYIAAMLNVAAGASAPLGVQEAMDAAADLLAACTIHPEDRPFALMIALVLDAYNNGWYGPEHCDDDPCPCPC